MGIFFGGSFTAGNCPGGNHPGDNFLGGSFPSTKYLDDAVSNETFTSSILGLKGEFQHDGYNKTKHTIFWEVTLLTT